LTEAVGDEAVERARGGDVASHRDVSKGEQGQDDRREQESGRGAEPVAKPDGDGHVARHRSDRRGIGDGHEDDRDDADGPLLQAGCPDLGRIIGSCGIGTH
jgi:hypothetical protein